MGIRGLGGVGGSKGFGGLWGFARAIASLAVPAASPATGATGGQLLAGLLNDGLRIGVGANHPDHQALPSGDRIQEQRRAQAHPAEDQLLLRVHRHGQHLGLLATLGRIAGGDGLLGGRHDGGAIASAVGETNRRGGLCIGAPTTATAASSPATAAGLTTTVGGTDHFGPGRGRRAHQTRDRGQGLEGVLAREHGHMAQAPAARAGPAEKFIDVLALAFAGQLHQAKLGELGNLGTGRVVAGGLGEVLQQLQLVAAGLHVDEVDDHHAADVAQLQLAGDLHRCFAVGPQDRLAGVGRAGERSGVDVDDRQSLGGLDDHVTTGGEINPGLEGIADGRVDPVVLQNFAGFAVVLHQEIGLVGAEEGIDPRHRIGAVDHHPQHIEAVEVAQDPMDEILIAVEQHRR